MRPVTRRLSAGGLRTGTWIHRATHSRRRRSDVASRISRTGQIRTAPSHRRSLSRSADATLPPRFLTCCASLRLTLSLLLSFSLSPSLPLAHSLFLSSSRCVIDRLAPRQFSSTPHRQNCLGRDQRVCAGVCARLGRTARTKPRGSDPD